MDIQGGIPRRYIHRRGALLRPNPTQTAMSQATTASVPFCDPAYIIRNAFGAYGYCSSTTLTFEVERECGLDREQARRAVTSFLTTDLRVRVDWLSNTWYIPGLGGA